MNIESFDESNGAISEKIILDERQKGLQIKIGREAMFIFAVLTLIYSITMDLNRWTESITAALLLMMCMCTLRYVIRCAVKGCMVAVRGRPAHKISFVCLTIGSSLQLIPWVSRINSPLKDGFLTNSFMFAACFILLIIGGTISLFAIYRESKASRGDGSK